MADYIFLRKNGKGADIKVSRQDFANNPNAYRDYTVRMVDKDGSNWDVPFNHINDAVKDGAHVFNMKDNTPQQKSTKSAPQPKSPVAQQAVNMANKKTQPYKPSWQEQAGLMMGVDQAASMGGSDVQPMVKPGLNTDMLNQKNALANRAMATNLESNQDNLYLDELQNKANELAKQGMEEVNAKEANKSFGQKVLENLSSTTKSGYSSTPYTREVENNEKIRQANLINANIQDARKAIKDAELSQNGSWYQLLGRGLANGVDVRNFDYGITNLRNALTLRNAAREGDSNNTNSAILDSEALKNKIIAENEDKISNLITAGETTTMMVPFMVQIGSSPLKGLGSGASKWVMSKVGQEIAGNLGKRAALLALKGTTRFLGDAVEGAGTAAFFNSAGIMADALKRQKGNAVGQYGSDGYFHYSDTEGGEDNFAKAFAKAFGASAIEYQSELVGEYFAPLLKGIGKVAGKGLQKAGVLGIKQGFDTTGKKFTNVMLNLGGKKMSLDKTIGMITALSNKQYIKAFKDFSKATQWHGVIGEFAEEVVGNIENAALIGDMNWGSGENGVFNPEQNWDTFLSVAVGSGFMGMLGGVSYMGSRLAVNRGLKKYDAMGQSLFGNDSWKAIKEGFETADNPARFLASISQNLDEPSKRAIQNYAAYSMAKKGELIADMKKRMEEPQPTNVRITPYKGKFVVQSVTADGTIIESKDYDNEEDANIYKERVRTYIDNARKVQDYNNFILRDDTEKLFDQLGIDEGSRKFLEKIAYKDPLKRTDEEQEHFDNFINSIENVTYPANEVHEEREAQKGADLAEETSENIVEGAKQPNDREAAAKTRWNAVVQSQPDIDSLVGSLVSQGMTSNEIAQRLVEDYGGESEVVAAFCELCNAKANKDGYINRIGQLIQSKVEDHVDEATFAGTINGTEDKNNIYQLTDGTNIFTLVGGNMTTDENGAISSDGLVVMRDNQGNFVQRENTNGLTVANVIDKEQYRQSLTTALQQQATAEIQASGNEVPEVQQPQATEPQREIPQQEQPQPQAQEQPQEQAEEQAEAVEKEPTIPVAENGQVLYHKAPIETTINEIYGALEDEDARQFVQNNINESSKEYDKINKKQPKIGTDINAYKQAKKDWQQQVEEAKQKLDYWNSVRDYIQKQTKTTPEEVKQTKDELSGKTAQEEYEKNKPNEAVNPVQRAGQFIRGEKIQTESFYKETGFGNAERQKFPGMVSNNGKTIDKLAEDLVAEDNSSNNGAMFHDDTMEAKNAIIEALQTAASKKELGKNTSEDFKEYERQRNEQREDFYQENFNMSYSDYLAFEEQIMPNIWRRMTNFVAEEYDRIVNESYEMRDERNNVEQINNENNGDNTEGNRQLAGGSEILPTEETAQQGGTATGSNATTETTNGSEGGNQNEEIQGGTQGVDVKDTKKSPISQENQQKSEEKVDEVQKTEEPQPLTEADIDADEVADDNQKALAKDFLNGVDTGIFAQVAYKNIQNRRDEKANKKRIEAAKDSKKVIVASVPKSEPKEKTEKKPEEKPKAESKAPNSDVDAAKANLNDVLKRFRAAGKSDLSVSLVGLNNKQIEMLGELFQAISHVGYAYIKQGIIKADEWISKMKSEVGDAIKDATGWTDTDIDEVFTQQWNTPYLVDGVRKPLKEWAIDEMPEEETPAIETTDKKAEEKKKGLPTREELNEMTKEEMIESMWRDVFPLFCEKHRVPVDSKTGFESPYWFSPRMTKGYTKDALVESCLHYIERLDEDVIEASEKQMKYIMSLADENEKQMFEGMKPTRTAASFLITLMHTENDAVTSKASTASDFEAYLDDIEATAKLNGGKALQSKAERKMSDRVKDMILKAIETGVKPFRSILDIRKLGREVGLEVSDNGETDIKLQELVEDGLVKAARQIMDTETVNDIAQGKNNKFSKEMFEKIKTLYEMQPTISRRSSNRIALQQYSTPLPMAFVADMFATGAKTPLMFSTFEPTAGNGMLVFAIPSSHVHVNEIDKNRLENLRSQDFRNVTTQDATLPFTGFQQYNAIITNPPFGEAAAKDYDGYKISGLAPQIALNALDRMKDNGKAVIIIGGEQKFAPNGAIQNDKPFLAYLYNHYNVKGVIGMDGSLYAKQGTTFPTRMILIDGRRTEEERKKSDVYPPTIKDWINKASDFDRLYDTVNELLNSKEKTNGTEIVRTEEQSATNIGNDTSRNTDVGGRKEQSTEGNQPIERVRGGLVSGNENVLVQPSRDDRNDGRGQTGGQGVYQPSDRGNDGRMDGGKNGGGRTPNEHGTSGRGADTVGQERNAADGRQRSLDSTVHINGSTTSGDGTILKDEKRSLESEKLPYRPHNGAFSLESVAPAAMVEAMDKTLKRIEEEYGNIDEFVTNELGYSSLDDMHKALAAEQVDSVAMAIYNMKKGEAIVIGDQTGVGKGRQMAALIRWARRQGKKPIFMTQKSNLFNDIYRDLKDIGSENLRPFIFNSDRDANIKEITEDKDGNEKEKVVYKYATEKELADAIKYGKIPDDYDFVLCTYSQVSTGDDISREYEAQMSKQENGDNKKRSRTRKPKPGAKPRKPTKATLLRALAKDNYLMLDESHTAAGESNQGYYMQTLVRDSKAVTFASATYAKRPDTMPLYALRTAMSKANIGMRNLIAAIQKGGVTLQELMSRALSDSGQMVRRERDMTGVVTDWTTIDDPATVKKARDNYDKTIKAFNAIIDFQKRYIGAYLDGQRETLAVRAGNAGFVKGTEDMGISNTPFANKTYNYTKQLMLALKVDAIVDEVDKQIKAGRRPVIALDNTMGSMLTDMAIGEELEETTFAASLLKGLDSIMQYSQSNGMGENVKVRISPSELGEQGELAYYNLVSFIKESTKGVFISPLDEISNKLRAKGYKVGELTGRDKVVVEENGKYYVAKKGKVSKQLLQSRFNSNKIDALIINKTGSTGISLHASKTFADQRQRVMILAQPLPDINDYMQMIGRIDRTGQVQRGYYINLGLPVPAEQRFLMMLSTKLKSLNANTTTSQDSKDNKVEAPDMLNKYGSIVIVEYFKDNPEIYNKMNDPLSIVKNGKSLSAYVPSFDDSDARKLTGYVALLSTDEQQAFYDDVVERYNALIKYLDDSGTNDLKITSLPLRAKTLAKAVSSEGKDPTGNNPFAQNAYVEKVEMDVLRKPMKADDIRKTINTLAEGKDPFEAVADIKNQWGEEYTAKREKENRRYEAELERNKAAVEKFAEKINANEKMPEKDKVKAINEKSTTLKNETERKHNENLTRLSNDYESLLRDFNRFSVGKTYIMPSDPNVLDFDYTSHAIFLGYKVKDKGITPSSSFAVFATLDGRRRVELKLSVRNALLNVEEITKQNYDAAQKVNLDNWDSNIPTTTRKEGYIMTGNILQAINDTQDDNGNFPGQLISYTDMEGNIRDGILMPDKWEPKMMTNAGSAISTALEQIKSGEIVISTNRDVEIHPTRSSNGNFMYYLRVPRSKKMGEKYYANSDLLKALGDKEFYEYSGTLQVSVDEEKLPDVLDVLSDMGVKVSSDIEGQLEEENATQQTNALAYNSSNNVNNSRIIPEDVDKDVSLQIENEFDSAIENLNLTEEEKTELENIIGEFSNLGTNDLEYTFYLNNSRLKIRDEKKNNLSEMLWRRGNSVSETTSSTGSNLRDEKSGTESPATENGEYSAVVSRRGEEAEGENTARGNEVQGQYNGPRDIRNAGSDGLLLHEGRRIEEKVLSKTPRTRLSSHQRRLLAAQYAISRELVYRDIRLAAIKDSLGLEAGKQTSLDDVAKIFEKYNKDKEVKALFDKILAINKRLGTSVEILASDENGNYGSAGTKRDVRYYLDGFTRTSSNQSVNIPLVIAHELLHQGTVGAINLVKKGKAEGVLTKEQIDAVNTILDIYNKVKANEGILSESKRGLANPYEFAAQMVDPRQRKALSMSPLQRVIAAANELKAQGNTSLWERIKNALKTLFGLSDLKKMDNAINTLLDTFSETVHDISMTDVDQNGWGYKVEDKATLDKLNSEPTVKVYRAMQVIDGKLYPPMAAKVNGSLVEPTKIGEWYQADEHPELIIPDGTYKDGTPKYKFKLDKGGKDATGKKATDIPAAYNPYWHTSRSPINDQFKSAWIRPNLVTVEVEVPESELTSGYKAQYAKDAVGEVEWKSGSVSGQLAKQGNPRKVILSRYNRLVRVVPVEEVADRFKEMLDGTGIEVPENTVTPQLRAALEAKGVKIGTPEKGVNKNAQIEEALNKGLEVDNTLYRRQENQPTSPRVRRVSDESQSQIRAHAQAVAEKLNTKLTFTTSDQLTGEKATAKGFYDTKTGKVTIVIDNNTDKLDVEKTILHEVVGHKGMRGLLGNVGYRKLLDAVYDSLSEEQKKDIKEKAMRNGYKFYQAMDEYFAEQAENMAWDSKSASMWDNIKHYVTEAIRKLGFIIRPNYRDIRYWLWLSKNQLQTDNPMSEIKRQAFLYKLGRLGAPRFDDMFNETDGNIDYTDVDTAFRNGNIQGGTAWQIIEQRLKDNKQYWKESFVDYMNAYRIFQEEMAKGIKGELMDNMNAYLGENQMSSKIAELQDQFLNKEVKNLHKLIKELQSEFGKGEDGVRALEQYLIMKHGLERNRVLFVRDWYNKNIRKAVKESDLPEEATQILEHLQNVIVTRFEDGEITEEQRDKLLERSIQDAWERYVNDKFDTFGKLHSRLSDRVEKGQTTLQEMYSELDAHINSFTDFDPNDNDKSGLSSMTEYYVDDKYSDDAVIQQVMSIDEMLGNRKTKLWEAVEAVTQKGLDYDYMSGIVGEEAYNRAKTMFHWYIPLRGMDQKTMEDQYTYIQNSSGIGKKSLVTAKGRTTLAKSPLSVATQMGLSAISRGERNINKQRAYRLVNRWLKENENEMAPATIVDVWYEVIGKDPMGNPKYEIAIPQITDDMNDEQVRQAVAEFNDRMEYLSKNGQAMKNKIPAEFLRPFDSRNHKSEHIVFVNINGRQKMIVFNGNPRPAQALNGDLNPSNSDNLFKKLMRMMAAAFTSYNPTFLATNLSRDILFSNSNVSIKEGKAYWSAFTKNQAKLLGNFATSYRKMWKNYNNGVEPTTDMERYFEEFMKNGGKTGFVNQKKIDELQRMLYNNEKEEFAAKSLSAVFELIENMNERVENMNRFAAYVTSRQKGRSVMRSISDAKEVSVNFNRKGAGSSTAKGENVSPSARLAGSIGGAFRSSYLFFNAGVQSFYTLARNIENHPFKTSAYAMAVPFIAGSFLVPMLNKIIGFLFGDDGDDEYANIPEWTRRNNICIYLTNGNWAKIPLPIELRAFYGLGDIAAGYTIDERLQSTQNLGIDIVSQLSQILPVDFMGEGGNVLSAFVPDVIKPVVQIMTNTDWTGKPIQKATTPFNQYDPEYTKAFKYEFEPFVKLSKKINNLTGGTDVTKGWYDGWWNSPAYWNHLIGGYGGGFVQDIMRTAKTSERLLTRDFDEWSIKEIPILKALFETPTERTQYYRVMNKFQMYRDEAAKSKHDLNKWRKSEDPLLKARYIHDTDNTTKPNYVKRMELVDKYLRFEKRANNIIDSPRVEEVVKKAKKEELTKAKIELVNKLDELE